MTQFTKPLKLFKPAIFACLFLFSFTFAFAQSSTPKNIAAENEAFIAEFLRIVNAKTKNIKYHYTKEKIVEVATHFLVQPFELSAVFNKYQKKSFFAINNFVKALYRLTEISEREIPTNLDPTIFATLNESKIALRQFKLEEALHFLSETIKLYEANALKLNNKQDIWIIYRERADIFRNLKEDVHYDKNEIEQANKDIDTALELNPKDPFAHILKGEILGLVYENSHKNIEEKFREALELAAELKDDFAFAISAERLLYYIEDYERVEYYEVYLNYIENREKKDSRYYKLSLAKAYSDYAYSIHNYNSSKDRATSNEYHLKAIALQKELLQLHPNDTYLNKLTETSYAHVIRFVYNKANYVDSEYFEDDGEFYYTGSFDATKKYLNELVALKKQLLKEKYSLEEQKQIEKDDEIEISFKDRKFENWSEANQDSLNFEYQLKKKFQEFYFYQAHGFSTQKLETRFLEFYQFSKKYTTEEKMVINKAMKRYLSFMRQLPSTEPLVKTLEKLLY